MSFALLGGNYFQDVHNFINTNVLFASSPSRGFVLGCVSAASIVYKSLWLVWGPQHFFRFLDSSPGWYLQVPGLIMFVFCLAVVLLSRRSREVALVGLFAMMQLAPASTYPYLDVNLVIELCLVLRLLARTPKQFDGLPADRAEELPLARGALVVCTGLLVIGCAPWLGLLIGSGDNTPIGELVASTANSLVVVIMVVSLLVKRRGRDGHRHSTRRKSAVTGHMKPPATLVAD